MMIDDNRRAIDVRKMRDHFQRSAAAQCHNSTVIVVIPATIRCYSSMMIDDIPALEELILGQHYPLLSISLFIFICCWKCLFAVQFIEVNMSNCTDDDTSKQ
jgi:hypothetical protein